VGGREVTLRVGGVVQVRLNAYLQYELYHALGAYGTASKRHGRLARSLKQLASLQSDDRDVARGDEPHPRQLAELARLASRYNRQLGDYRHGRPRGRRSAEPYSGRTADGWPSRAPIPDDLPLTNVGRFGFGVSWSSLAKTRDHPWKVADVWERIPKFYGEAAAALELDESRTSQARRPATPPEGDALLAGLQDSLLAHRDGAVPLDGDRSADELLSPQGRARRRKRRYEQRRDDAHAILAPHVEDRADENGRSGDACDEARSRYAHDPGFLRRLCTDNLGTDRNSLSVYVVSVLSEAHLSMHAAESWKSMCLGEYAVEHGKETRDWLKLELRRCIALDTFAYSVSRAAPWLFAADADECAAVFGDVAAAWENLVPARCMWISVQIGLLALHRRAYARALNHESKLAYNDYHKLQRLIRDAERRIRAAAIHMDGALEFLAALDGQAHHHIGELYRAEHAYRPARAHFNRATHRLDALRKKGEMTAIMPHSRRSVELQVSHGKASYEMGRHKEALCWHLRGWQAFLRLLAEDTDTASNTDEIQAAIEWLERVRYEPEIRKSELTAHLRPVVEQLVRVSISRRYGALASEILLRLGHLLFVLNLGGEPRPQTCVEDPHRVEHTLAYECLCKAFEWDSYSTQIDADLLKGAFRLKDLSGGTSPRIAEVDPARFRPVGEQWTRGGNDFEQLARSAEYLTLRRQRVLERMASQTMASVDGTVARGLLRSFFMNSDSINVRKSQVYRMLMEDAQPSRLPSTKGGPAIEFICMRRYSSPFPLLPRPSAFRALGGGYFIRLHPSDEASAPFGVVVDPGSHFVENLFRTGYSLGDVDLIVVTHDHVDHAGSLDVLLSLIHVRAQTLKHEPGGQPQASVTVLMSASMFARYEKAERLQRGEEVKFRPIEERDDDGPVRYGGSEIDRFPEDFELFAMSSKEVDTTGHLDLSEKASWGISIRAREHPATSIALTSDTPPPPAPEDKPGRHRWFLTWGPALEASILVAHLSSVPLTELRQLSEPAVEPAAALGGAIAGEAARESAAAAAELSVIAQDEGRLEGIREQLEAADPSHAGVIEWGLWLRSGDGEDEHSAPMVGPVRQAWEPPSGHSFLKGLLRWARTYAEVQDGKVRGKDGHGLFIVGELSEELGTMRAKVAASLNEWVFGGTGRERSACALSGDIGLSALITSVPSCVRVLCTTCNQDTDRIPDEQYHVAADVLETCVKGENEGIFYNCREHAPTTRHDPVFLEQLERFDIYGR
jgi:hypothetical protein